MQQQGSNSQTTTHGLWCYTHTTASPKRAKTQTLHAAAQQNTVQALSDRPQPLPLMTQRSKRQAKLSSAVQITAFRAARAWSSAASAAA